jgi:hypothetical protein
MSERSFHLRRHPNKRWYAVTRTFKANGRSGELVVSTHTDDEEKAKAWAADWVKKLDAERVRNPPPFESVLPSSRRAPAPPLLRRERARDRAAELINRLRGVTPAAAPPPLGDVPPPPPADTPPLPDPELLAPGVREEQKKKEAAEELDQEANELFADMAAGGIVGGHLRAVKNFCANQEPPRKAEEPNEMCLEWERAGVAKKMRRLFGKSGGMSETTKLLVGIAGVTLSMVWGAEIIEPKAGAQPQPARPAPQPQPPPAPQPQPAPAPPPPPPAARQPPARALSIVPPSPPETQTAGSDDAAAGKF